MMNSRRHKVAVLASTLIVGGAERQLQALARGLRARDFEFHFFFFKEAGTIGRELAREGWPVEERVAARPWRWARLLRELATFDALLVLDHSNCLRLAGAWARDLPPYVVLYHLQAAPPRTWRRALTRAAAVVAVSRSQLPLISKRASGAAVEYIPNGVAAAPAIDADARRAAREHFGIPAAAFVAVCVARLSREKGIDVLLDTAADLDDGIAYWLIVGDGSERRPLEAAARERLAAATYLFAGELADVAPAYEAADVFVLPSRQESTPMALLEALARGLPAVAAAVGDVPAILAEVGGITFPAGDGRALGAAVTRLAGDAAARAVLGQKGRAVAAAAYSLETMLATYEVLLARVAAEGRG